jgi:hypothetical protein
LEITPLPGDENPTSKSLTLERDAGGLWCLVAVYSSDGKWSRARGQLPLCVFLSTWKGKSGKGQKSRGSNSQLYISGPMDVSNCSACLLRSEAYAGGISCWAQAALSFRLRKKLG